MGWLWCLRMRCFGEYALGRDRGSILRRGWLTRVFLTWNVKFCGDELLPLFSCNGVVVWREGFFFHEYCCQKNPHNMKSGKSLV